MSGHLGWEATRTATARRAARARRRAAFMGGTIHARYSSICPTCGDTIAIGDEISPTPNHGHAHTVCPARRARHQHVVSLRPGQEGRPDGMLHQG